MAVHKDKAIGRRDLSGNLDAAVPVAGLSGGVARVIDVVGASIGLLFFGPILLVVALAIKLKSPGPVLVREVQYGSKNRRIEVLKFRLMSTGTRGEQRYPHMTRIGRILRGIHVDELLRLVNVLRGEASFFGPRP